MKFTSLSLISLLTLGAGTGVYATTNATSIPTPSTAESANETAEEVINPSTLSVSESASKEIALNSVAGATFSTITLDDENGTIVYSVSVQSGSKMLDIKVDANTGAIISTDSDDDSEAASLEADVGAKDIDNVEFESQVDDGSEPDSLEADSGAKDTDNVEFESENEDATDVAN